MFKKVFLKLFLSLVVVFCFFIIQSAQAIQQATTTPKQAAQPFTGQVIVTPTVIDETGKPRDIFKYKIKIKNNTDHKADLYAFVFNVYPKTGQVKLEEDSAHIDRSTSLVSWIKFRRGVISLMPGEETEVPLEINISCTAKTGVYYGKIVLAEGSNRPLAKKRAFADKQPTINLRVAVQEIVIEQAELKDFNTVKTIFLRTPVDFSFKVKNIGNQDIVPTGGIRIYNRRGQEVEMLYVEKKTIAAGKSQNYRLSWLPQRAFGRYRARLILDYGSIYQRDLQDTLYFWILPWPFLIGFVGGLVIVLILLVSAVVSHRHHRPQVQTKSNGVINLRQKK